ncbi:Zuotin [Podosphaera aphanis]|nr:Zuotin [Podosphaera aphanis]
MATCTQISIPLPVLPEGWSEPKDFKAVGKLSLATQRSLEPVGPHFLAHARRARFKRTFSEDDRIQARQNVKKVEDEDIGDISEPEDPSMLLRDAKDWKSQDHYAVLGLSKYRYRATEDQIKRAHRKKVLRHHPDKKAAAGSTEDDSFFKCIQKATEVLLDPVKRRQFDSVDEAADVQPPTKKQQKDGKYYKLWSNVFKAEGRFSREQPVPKFGDENSTQEEVETFYNFFYNFDSWRSFEYQDEDVPDDNENRDQKRHMERKNNNARKKKKNEDVARLRKLVDDAMAGDERIKKFRQAASANKNKKRLEKEAAEKAEKEAAAAEKAKKETELKEAEEKAKADREQGKKAKEAAKAAVKKNRRVLKGSIKDANYFCENEASASKIDSVLGDVELVQGKLDPDETAVLAGKLAGLKVAAEIKGIWSEEIKRLVAAGKVKEGEAATLA